MKFLLFKLPSRGPMGMIRLHIFDGTYFSMKTISSGLQPLSEMSFIFHFHKVLFLREHTQSVQAFHLKLINEILSRVVKLFSF